MPKPAAPSVAPIDWPRLLLAGSILARSDQRIDQEAALWSATAAISLTDDYALKDTDGHCQVEGLWPERVGWAKLAG